MHVYRLETYRFIEKSRRFMRSNPRTIPDFHPYGLHDELWVVPRLSPKWREHKLVGEVDPENDFPGEGGPSRLTPVFSERAVEGLRDFLQPNGELLPVRTPLGKYYAFNLTKVVDALDLKRSIVVHGTGKWKTWGIRRFFFRPKRVEGLTIFRIPQLPSSIFVTEPFVERVNQLGLNGHWLIRLWPLPRGTRWPADYEAEIGRMKAQADKEAEQSRPARAKPERSVAPKRAPRLLDLRLDVDALLGLLRRVLRQIERKQPHWKSHGEQHVSVIGLETIGWNRPDGPLIMCHFDLRDRHLNDAHWTDFDVARLKRSRWSAFLGAIDERAESRQIIDASGQTHAIGDGDVRLCRWMCGAMSAALLHARELGLFQDLMRPNKCILVALDTDSGFYWSSSAVGRLVDRRARGHRMST